MNLRRLLSASRFSMCRTLFQRPLRSLTLLASFHRDSPPAEFVLADGTQVQLRVPHKSNWFWDHIQSAQARVEGGLVDFKLNSTKFRLPVNDHTVTAVRWFALNAPTLDSLTWENGLMRAVVAGRGELLLRPESRTDWVVLREVFISDEYGIDELPQSLGTVVDCGANIGAFSCRIGPKADRIILIEPVPANLEMVRKNLKLAVGQDRAIIEEAALGTQSGKELSLWVAPEAQGCNSVVHDHTQRYGQARELKVPTVSLSDLFEKHKVTSCGLLKCDIEGAEYDALDAVHPDLWACISRIQMEFHLFQREEWVPRFESLRQKLTDAGFQLKHTSTHTPEGSLVEAGYLVATRIRGEELNLPDMQVAVNSPA